jgi:hypothetical protein
MNVGPSEGTSLGECDGTSVAMEGFCEGYCDDTLDGNEDGALEGILLGTQDGERLAIAEGLEVIGSNVVTAGADVTGAFVLRIVGARVGVIIGLALVGDREARVGPAVAAEGPMVALVGRRVRAEGFFVGLAIAGATLGRVGDPAGERVVGCEVVGRGGARLPCSAS